MENLNIGRSGIEVPFLGMGTWAIGGGSWQGIRWIDTAPIYGLYHSETVVGEALKHIDRDKVVLSTKCGLEWRHETPVLHKVVDGTAVYRDLSAQSIIEDDTLVRLISMPNVIVTSHQAFLTKEALSNIAATTVDNLLKFERGEPSPDTEVCYHCERKETCRKARDQKCF